MRVIRAARQVSFKDAYLSYWLRWSDYRGRSSRQEYWKLILDNVVIGFVLSVFSASVGASWIMVLWEFINLVPATTLAIRRLHDSGHTGKWIMPLVVCNLLLLIFSFVIATSSLVWIALAVLLVSIVIGTIVFVFVLQQSKPDNAWGLSPQ